jgi:hypothetical protein
MDERPFGPARATLARSLNGLFIGIVTSVVVVAALVVWNVWFDPGAAAMIAATAFVLAVVPAGVSFARAPYTITIHDEGLRMKAHGRARVHLRWSQIRRAQLRRGPGAKRSRVVSLQTEPGAIITISEVEYSSLDALLEALRAHLPERMEEAS